jgi:hypothetical protein
LRENEQAKANVGISAFISGATLGSLRELSG